MTFSVKDIFYTLQGEGHHSGRPAVFVRFAGCNGWSGREKDRENGPLPCSRWCDTDFVGGEKLSEDELVNRIASLMHGCGFVVFTGGEPALQLTSELILRLSKSGIASAVETNGTVPLPEGVYWRTVSPKTPKPVVTSGNELKLIYPSFNPATFINLDFRYFYLQPLDSANIEQNTAEAIEYCMAHPQWRLSTQMHKTVGLP